MQLAQFWKIIDDARSAVVDSPDERDDFLVRMEESLLELEPSEVASFQTHLSEQFNRTFHWDVIAAAAIIYGDKCDPLDIDGFRAWLISRGEEFLTKTLQDVDSLGPLNLVPDDLYYYAFLSLPTDAYEELSGDEIPAEATPPAPGEPASTIMRCIFSTIIYPLAELIIAGLAKDMENSASRLFPTHAAF